MRFLLLLFANEITGSKVSMEDMEAVMGEFSAYGEAMHNAGVRNITERLHPTSMATTVRVKNGKVVTVPGPYAKAKEQIGGFYIIDVKNMDEAIDWAAKCPGVQWGSIEVRQIMEG
jgi:hypothetical protein